MESKAKQTEIIEYLRKRLKQELPASEAHVKMIPKFGGSPHRTLIAQPGARHAAVLVLLVPGQNDKTSFDVLFTLRSTRLNKHTGQISFPGGRTEPGENAIETALRETDEEIGLKDDKIDIIGTMSTLYVQPTKWIITPVVAYIEQLPELVINEDEVEEVFLVPLKKFFLPEFLLIDNKIFNGSGVEVPYWDVHPKTPLWGATAMILMELLQIYEEAEGNSEL